MNRFCEGEGAAFDALFHRYSGPIHGFLCRLVQSAAAADDLTQASFLSLVRARDRFQQGARFKPWLYAIATNAARDHLRRGGGLELLTAQGELPPIAAEDVALKDVGLERVVLEALAQLPDAQREAIVLHRFEELSFAEIATATGVTESAAKVRAHRGYERLRALLRGIWEDR